MKKKNILFFCIGNRHVTINGKYLAKDQLRDESERVLSDYEAQKEAIELQIIPPVLDAYAPDISKIILIVTDQADPNHKSQDTLFLGQIVKQKILEYHPCHIEIKKFENNPTDFEKIFPYMTDLLLPFAHNGGLKVVCNSGGTPQMKQSLVLLASNLLPAGEVEVCQVDEKTGAVKSVALDRTLRLVFIKNACRNFVHKYEYAAALELLREYAVSAPVVERLLEYGKHRLTFDFDSANKAVEQLRSKYVSQLDFNRHFRQLLLVVDNRPQKMAELLLNLKIQWEKENYVGFLSRLFRLEEEIYYHLIQQKYQIDVTDINNHEKFLDLLRQDNEMRTYLESKYYRGKPLNFKVSKPLLVIVLQKDKQIQSKYLKKLDDIGRYSKNISEASDAASQQQEGLDRLRNRSIAAHGFEPISRQSIEKHYTAGIDSLLKNLEFIVGDFVKTSNASFTSLNDLLFKYIEKI